MTESKKYRVRVVRKQAWQFEVEADSKEDAMSMADGLAENEPPHDDWAYSTEAQELS